MREEAREYLTEALELMRELSVRHGGKACHDRAMQLVHRALALGRHNALPLLDVRLEAHIDNMGAIRLGNKDVSVLFREKLHRGYPFSQVEDGQTFRVEIVAVTPREA